MQPLQSFCDDMIHYYELKTDGQSA